MTGMKRSSEGLDPRRRKLLFMCWHRGIREMDLIMGRFADENIDRLSDDEIADLARAVAARGDAPATSLVVICRDGPRMAALARGLSFFAPDIAVQELPAWDCLPYDRVSPHAGTVAQRMITLSRLARKKGHDKP